MSDRFSPMPIHKMLSWILREYDNRHSVFGIRSDLFFHPDADDVFTMKRYGRILQTPIGVAAGPHTQLSQNIVAAWLCGARYIELKTIQTLDELEISKPCIDMEDEGYNCEWSQELKLRQSFDEYLNAWIIIHVLTDKFHWQTGEGPGMIFNMSAGYNSEGILNHNVQDFLNLMENAVHDMNIKLNRLEKIYPRIRKLRIPHRISDNLTVSTMHGCPPEEIEKICRYFMEQRKYHTTVKLNPTLLGPDHLRDILHEQLKFESVVVPDEAFEHDLKYNDALNLIGNLQKVARENQVRFGLKLTNTLEVKNVKDIFPSNETMSYLSGRALHPVSIGVAAKLQREFDGKLDISFSAGADAFNTAEIIACNIKPVTACTDILKPGGYMRLKQYLTELENRMTVRDVRSIDDYILKTAGDMSHVHSAGLKNLNGYAQRVLEDSAYKSRADNFDNIKTRRPLTSFDCVKAPCTVNCAAEQDIPQYIYHTARREFDKALEVILDTNPLPGITGYVCDHLCQMKCTRQNMDSPLLIREIKRFVLENGNSEPFFKPENRPDKKAAVVGAGPSGLSCAYFLTRAGFQVDIFESQEKAGGMVSHALPVFRLPESTILDDTEMILKSGIIVHYRASVGAEKLSELQKAYDFVYLSVGAQLNKKLNIPGEDLNGVMEPLVFLSRVRSGIHLQLGLRIAVIGGGNTAIDAARTARRIAGNNGEITILYRRSIREMPADRDEVLDALQEGIRILELTAPVKIESRNGALALTCEKMILGEKDASGRARPVRIPGSEFLLTFDTIIPAIGQDIAPDILPDEKSDSIPVRFSGEYANVFSGGDAIRGASSVVNAVGDGQKAAKMIIQAAGLPALAPGFKSKKSVSADDLQKKLSARVFGQSIRELSDHSLGFDLVSRTMTPDEAVSEANRCLYCDEVCSICVSVCPNLANVFYECKPCHYETFLITGDGMEPRIQPSGKFTLEQIPQVLNIADFCNECGNCTTFCPTSGKPFIDKPRFHLTEKNFITDPDGYFIHRAGISGKRSGKREDLVYSDNKITYSNDALTVQMERSTLRILSVDLKKNNVRCETEHIVHLHILYENLKYLELFREYNESYSD